MGNFLKSNMSAFVGPSPPNKKFLASNRNTKRLWVPQIVVPISEAFTEKMSERAQELFRGNAFRSVNRRETDHPSI